MTHSLTQTRRANRLMAQMAAVFGVLIAGCCLFATSQASAAYEQVGTFADGPPVDGVFPEEVQLGGVGAMAINRTGAGGVPAGTLYAANYYPRVVRYTPVEKNGHLRYEFSEGWFIDYPPFADEVKRCGPEGNPEEPTCSPFPGGTNNPALDVEVDQSTGYVYTFADNSNPVGSPLIAVYSADGSEVIDRFGIKAGFSDTIDDTPDQLHRSSKGSLAIDQSTGNVYVYDYGYSGGEEFARIMVWEPETPGDYSNYVYSGRSHDIWAGKNKAFPSQPHEPVTDDDGYIYISSEQYIGKIDPSDPSGPPVCGFSYKKGGIEAATVNPITGEVFFSRGFKDGNIYQLRGQCGDDGQFVEAGSVHADPERAYLSALTVDPERSFDSTRGEGLLLGGAPMGPGPAVGYIFAPPLAIPPSVASESVTSVTSSGATVSAAINPRGNLARYRFQYLTEAAFDEAGETFAGAAEAPLGGAVVGEGSSTLTAAASLTGLDPDTTYRFRVVATSFCNASEPEVECEAVGDGDAFHTFPVQQPGLPDGRVWEMVSPVQKHGGQVFPSDPLKSSCMFAECKPGSLANLRRFPYRATADGDAIAYRGEAFSNEEGAVAENQYVARRTSTGWATASPTPSLITLPGSYANLDSGLEDATIYQDGPSLSPDAPPGFQNIYFQPLLSPFGVTPLLKEAPPNRPAEGLGRFELRYVGASEDLSRVFFLANDALTEATDDAPEAPNGGATKSNLYEWSGGSLKLVNVDPGNGSAAAGVSVGDASSISVDGSRVFWQGANGEIYRRDNAAETVLVSASQKAVADPVPAQPTFLMASNDGSRALFSSSQKLTDDSNAGNDLYLWDEGSLTDLSAGALDPGGFRKLIGASEDLSSVYFIDTARLDTVPNERGEAAAAGAENLYLYRSGETRFIAVDNPRVGSWPATTSPNGDWLAFSSIDRLTGFDNTGPCIRNVTVSTGPCVEVFLYDSGSDSLSCPSCNPGGATPLGSSSITEVDTRISQRELHFVTDSGRLYFDSQDSLVPADTNAGAEDVYQYEPGGVGTCDRDPGCVSLISAGRNSGDSNLAAIDPSGKNVFFTTWDQLGLKDEDDLMDLYVAREGGGIASEAETGRPECLGEGCLPAVVPPNDPTPGSATFNGAGNVRSGANKPCPKGKVRRKGKCVKKKQKNASHSSNRKHHRRGGSK